MSTQNTFVNEPDRVIIYDDFATEVIHAGLDYSEHPEAAKSFTDQFEVIEPRGHFLADPNEDFYQGVNVMAVIKRKADGRLFGFPYWTPISKHGEAFVEPNGDAHGFEFDPPQGFDWDKDYFPSPYVWLPIEPFNITGYKIIETKESK